MIPDQEILAVDGHQAHKETGRAMPKLTVIEGGGRGRGPNDPNSHNARVDLAELFVEVLRTVARGNDDGRRLTEKLVTFINEAPTFTTRLDVLVNEVLQDFNRELAPSGSPEALRELESIVLLSLYLAAETCAGDQGARGRAEKRQLQLFNDIERIIVRREVRRLKRDRPKGKGRIPSGKKRK